MTYNLAVGVYVDLDSGNFDIFNLHSIFLEN